MARYGITRMPSRLRRRLRLRHPMVGRGAISLPNLANVMKTGVPT